MSLTYWPTDKFASAAVLAGFLFSRTCPAGAVRRGEEAPSRVWELTREPRAKFAWRQLDPEEYRRARRAEWENSPANTRARLGPSPTQFAELLGISVKTLHTENENWAVENRPAARVLLRVAALTQRLSWRLHSKA